MKPTSYRLMNVATGRVFDDAGWTMGDPEGGSPSLVRAVYENKQFIYDWFSAVSEGIAKGWSKDECVERINFADRCPVDIGQADAMDYIQTHNVMVVYDYLTDKLGK